MKKLVAIIFMIICIGMGLRASEFSYENINPHTLPTYVGSLTNPNIQVVYEDPNGTYVLVLINGVLYVYYL